MKLPFLDRSLSSARPLVMHTRLLTSLLLMSLCLLSSCDGSDSNATIVSTPTPDPEPEPDPVPDPDPIELVVRVSQDMSVLRDASISVSGEVLVDGVAATVDSVLWDKESGPGLTTFSDATALTTQVSFDTAGDYVLTMTAEFDSASSSDSLRIVVTDPLVNAPPVVGAGDDVTIEYAAVHALNGTVSDDDLPTTNVTVEWSQISGPGTATFDEVSQLNTNVTFDAEGVYLLQLLADDGELSTLDTVEITVEAEVVQSLLGEWQTIITADASEPQGRHEAAAVAVNDNVFLLGGRGIRSVDRYTPVANLWEALNTPNRQLHHFQPVAYNDLIYVIGALDCCYPSESVVDTILIFDPATSTWSDGPALPANRLRGAAGAVNYEGKLYFIGGTTNGHSGGTVDWFDVYDPVADTWTTLPDAPHKRDHFYAAVLGNRLYAIGGRLTGVGGKVFGNLVSEVDVFNFDTMLWETDVPDLPLPRAGAMVVAHNNYIVVLGGEMELPGAASKRVDAYDTVKGEWYQLDDMIEARHSGGAVMLGKELHVIAGSSTQGNAGEHNKHERYLFEQ